MNKEEREKNIDLNNQVNSNTTDNEIEKIETKGLKLKKSTKDRLNSLQSKFDDAETMIVSLLNQYETFSIENNEKFSDRKSEIDRFNFLLDSIKNAFVNSLEMASFIQDKYNENLKKELEKKDKIISFLQHENNNLKETISENSLLNDRNNKELVSVKDSFSRVNLALTTVEKELKEKSEIIQNLQLHISSLTEISKESKNSKTKIEELTSELNQKKNEINDLKLKCEKTDYIINEKDKYKDEIELLKRELNECKIYNVSLNEKVQNILVENSLQVSKLNDENNKYIRSIEEKNKLEILNLNEKLNKIKDENFELKLKLRSNIQNT